MKTGEKYAAFGRRECRMKTTSFVLFCICPVKINNLIDPFRIFKKNFSLEVVTVM